nr:uncharacterized protein LOC113397096 [Vanessa tameamea]
MTHLETCSEERTMAIKIFPFLLALLAALLVVKTVSCEEIERPGILFIENPDTFPKIISPSSALMGATRNNLVCTATMCGNVCRALNFRFGRCNSRRVCVCSNF